MKLICSIFLLTGLFAGIQCNSQEPGNKDGDAISLPSPGTKGDVSIESTLENRRSVREFSDKPLTLSDIGQILWAAQGITEKMEQPPAQWKGDEWMGGKRTAPSAGALYPMEIYLIASRVEGLDEGVYWYHPGEHELRLVLEGEIGKKLASAALGQSCIRQASANIVMTGVYERTANKYGERAQRYVHIETGAVAQNIYLQAESLDLGTVFVGAFQDEELIQLLELPEKESPLGIMPLGHSR
ncbi:MAG: SagB/ThcOx family dehydrogenase [Bacteroidales bacterium]